ncbi:hypothetical protein J4226_00185 [Candidatus Pacearchaeota archaeon]|nr:hypothetical protein [Candidatus Pacearchaeota archaeon]
MKSLVNLILNEIFQAEKIRGKPIRLTPIADFYKQTDPRFFMNYMRDYLYFADEKHCITLSMHTLENKKNHSGI